MTRRLDRRCPVVLMLIGSCLSILLTETASAQPRTNRVGEIPPLLINDVEAAKLALHPLRPFVEPSTFLIVDLSLTEINAPAMTTWLKENLAEITRDAPIDFVSAMIQGNLQQLRDSGAGNLYAMVSTRIASDRAPVIAIPCRETATIENLARGIVSSTPSELNLGVKAIGRVVLIGPKGALDRLESQQNQVARNRPAELDRLLIQLTEPTNLPHRLVFRLPPEAREELMAFWPESMPEGSPIHFSPRQVVADLASLNVSWRLPPEPSVHIEIEAMNEAGARDRLSTVARDLIALLPEVSQNLRLTAREGNLVLDADTTTIKKLVEHLAAPLRENVDRQRSMSNAKQLMLAMHMHHEKHGHFPAPAITDENGQPLLSWRVAILPFIEQKALYDQFKLDEPWDSEHNAKLVSKMPAVLGDAVAPAESGKTRFRLPEIAGGAWGKRDKPLTFSMIIDGTSATIAFVQAPGDAAVPWTQPETFDLENGDPAAVLFGDQQQIITARFDGSVFVVTKDEMPAEKLLAWLTIAGKEVVQ